MFRLSLPFVCLAIAAAPARAEKLTETQMLSRMFGWARLVNGGYAEPGATAEQCFADLASAKESGFPGTYVLSASEYATHPRATGKDGNAITLDDVAYYCERYREVAGFAVAYAAISHANTFRQAYEDGGVSADRADPETLAACYAAVDAAKQAGVSDDYRVSIDGLALAFGEVRATVCDGLARAIELRVREDAAALAVLRAKYAKHGAKGERLDFLVEHDQRLHLAGGEHSDDPARLARAKALYQWMRSDDPVDDRYQIHTVRKFEFKGNKLARQTEQTYRLVQGMRPPAKAFK